MTRNSFVRKKINLNSLELDEHNARIRHGISQADCIAKILKKEDQLLVLMKSIADDGLSTMPILVSKSSDNGRKWRVWDGNRRVTALKLLNRPSLCRDNVLRAKIERIVAGASSEIPKSVECLWSDSEDVLIREVVSRHSGALEGAGQLGWSAYLRTLFLIGHGQPAEYKRAGLYLFWAEENGIYVDDGFPISTLTRFATAENLSRLGVVLRDGEVSLTRPKDDAIRIAQRVIYDLSSGDIKVGKVHSPSQGSDYVSNVLSLLGIQGEPQAAPQDAQVKSEGASISSSTEMPESSVAENASRTGSGGGSEADTSSGDADSEMKPFRARRTGERDKIFNRKTAGFDVPPEHRKVRDIIAEIATLKHTGKAGTPISLALLLRALIELSTDNYRRKNPEIKVKDENLRNSVKACAQHMFNKSLLSEDQMNNVLAHCNKPGDMLNITTLQGYVHSTERFPSGETLNYMWEQIGSYVRGCWKSTL